MHKTYAAIAMAALLAIGIPFTRSHPAVADTASAVDTTLPTVLSDASRTLKLVVNLQSGYLDTGKFDLAVTGQGFYEGVIPLSQSGPHIVHLQGQIPAQVFASDTDAVRQTTLKMEGIVDTSDNSANINVWVDGTHYHLQTDNGKGSSPAPVAARVVALIKARDWTDLYPYLDDQIRGAYTQAQFTQSMASQDDGDALVDLAVSGAGQDSTSQLGVTTDVQPVAETTRNTDGTTTTTTTIMYLVYEDGVWHYASTDPIPSDPVNAKITAGQP